MTEAEGTFVNLEHFLELLKTLPWCKQGTGVLIAVHKCTPDVAEVIKDSEVKVFPGGMNIKLNKSMLKEFQEKFDEGQPLPVVVVWKTEGVEIWFRRQKSADFPYDSWTNPAAAAYERERAFVPASQFSSNFSALHAETIDKSKECPSMIPPH